MVIPLLIGLAQTSTRQWVKFGWLAAALSTAFTVISTFSRGGFLAMATGAFVLILLNPKPMRKLAAAAALSIVAVAIVPIPDGYFDRLHTIETYDEIEEESALGRLHIWSVALDIARDHPMGIGLWNFESVYDQYDPDGSFGENRAVHNSHLQALVEAGWIGGAVWECLIFGGLFVAWRTRKRAATLGERAVFFRTMANAFIASQVGFLVGGTFVSMAYNDLTWLGFGCVAALDRLVASETALVQEPSASFALQDSGPRMVPARLPNRVNIGARR
jgi:O-antigen ligase